MYVYYCYIDKNYRVWTTEYAFCKTESLKDKIKKVDYFGRDICFITEDEYLNICVNREDNYDYYVSFNPITRELSKELVK